MKTTVSSGEHTSSPSPSPGGPVQEWLASAHPSPSTVRNEWISAAKLALIPLGHAFEAVRLPEDIVHRIAATDAPSVVQVPPDTGEQWLAPVVECLGKGTYLGVPRTDRTELDEETRASYWVVPMAHPGALCTAADVLALVMAGGCLADEDES
jgi:hypothetical protein